MNINKFKSTIWTDKNYSYYIGNYAYIYNNYLVKVYLNYEMNIFALNEDLCLVNIT